jgi:hypothetical protein
VRTVRTWCSGWFLSCFLLTSEQKIVTRKTILKISGRNLKVKELLKTEDKKLQQC